MADNFANAGVYLLQTFFGLYTLMVMVRVLMQVARADYYNPICQAIVKITDPAVRPFRAFLPSVMGVDFASGLGAGAHLQPVHAAAHRGVPGRLQRHHPGLWTGE